MPLATLDAVFQLAAQGGRVCPLPDAWCALYDMLPARRSDVYGEIPAPPLVLDAWHSSSDADKRERLRVHLRWAASHGVLGNVHAWLVLLPESRWHHAPS